jgi:protein O-GlcNAc transferase
MPDATEIHAQAESLLQAGKPDQALGVLTPALQQSPSDPVLLYLQAFSLMALGKTPEAAQSALRAANAAPPKSPLQGDASNLLCGLLIRMGRPVDAMKAANAALSILPNSADVHTNLAVAAALTNQRAFADQHFRRAIELSPDHAQAIVGYARFLRDVGRVDRAVPLLQRAVSIAPQFFGAWENLAPALNYFDRQDPKEVLAAHRRVGEFVAARPPKLPPFVYSQTFDPDRVLRVGMISGDLRTHSVAMFLEPLLRESRPLRAEIYLYSSTANPDDTTKRLRGCVKAMREIRNVSDAHAAHAIHADAIDVLIDLGGYTATSRVHVLRHRPAPVQATYLGYPATTGLSEIDARLVDSITDPPGSESHCSERLIRLDPCFLCYRPDVDSLPRIGALPADRNGFVTFCSFNTITKLGPATAAAWAKILRSVPNSRLLLKAIGIHDEFTRDSFLELFTSAGADLSRIDIRPYAPTRAEHLAAYNDADIALDPFPYNGTATTCEALSMGVPVLSVEGRTHVSRVGRSLLSATGIPELCFGSVEAMIGGAVELANDRARLHGLRSGLRSRLLASNLANSGAFADRVHEALRSLWRARCVAR